jgi:hypothetical protein
LKEHETANRAHAEMRRRLEPKIAQVMNAAKMQVQQLKMEAELEANRQVGSETSAILEEFRQKTVARKAIIAGQAVSMVQQVRELAAGMSKSLAESVVQTRNDTMLRAHHQHLHQNQHPQHQRKQYQHPHHHHQTCPSTPPQVHALADSHHQPPSYMPEHQPHHRDITPPPRLFYNQRTNIAYRQIDFDSPTNGKGIGGIGSAKAAATMMAAATTAKEHVDLHGPNPLQRPPNNLDLTSSCYEYEATSPQREVNQYLPSGGGFSVADGVDSGSAGGGEQYSR